MHVLLAPDKFKGSLTAAEVADALAEGLAAGNPSWRITCAPVADGGDGTVAAAVAAGWMPVAVQDHRADGSAHCDLVCGARIDGRGRTRLGSRTGDPPGR